MLDEHRGGGLADPAANAVEINRVNVRCTCSMAAVVRAFEVADKLIARHFGGGIAKNQNVPFSNPEAVDLAFGAYVRYGTILKQYRNAKIIYTPSEMIGTKRTPRKGMAKADKWTICTSHVERLNGTQRLMLKRLNRLTYRFSKRLRNLEAAFSLFAAWYNFTWRTRKPGKSGKLRPTAAMMAGLTDHLWTFDELFDAVLAG